MKLIAPGHSFAVARVVTDLFGPSMQGDVGDWRLAASGYPI